MINYNSKSWINLIRDLSRAYKYSFNLKQLLKIILVVGLYTTVVTVSNIRYGHFFTIDTFYFSLMGLILSLFLVFRLNSAYDKWWEGRIQWGKLVNDSRTLVTNLNSLIPKEDHERRNIFAAYISNFAVSLKEHLRDNRNIKELILLDSNIKKKIEKIKHIPVYIASLLFEEMEKMFKISMITEADKINLKVQIQGFIDVLGACERIKKTPIPFSHSMFIKNFIVLYIIALPFGLVEVFSYITIPAVLLMTYALVGIEVISEEIEMPFGIEANDLPTGQIAQTISLNVFEVMDTKYKLKDKHIYDHEEVGLIL